MDKKDSFQCIKTLTSSGKTYNYCSLPDAVTNGLGSISKLPFSLKVLLENLLRHEGENGVTKTDIQAVQKWQDQCRSSHEIAYHPARVLMQDFTGVPAVVDLAAMREAMVKLGGDPKKINPLAPVDLVIDHSVMVDHYGQSSSLQQNVDLEFQRNQERYSFLKWAQGAFDNFRVVPPGTGICHQVNLEYLAKVVWTQTKGQDTWAYPDTLVGTDSHTTMINGLSVLGWGVGGIEAEAAMLSQPISMLIPEVVGFEFVGSPKEGTTATDIVLTVVQMLRELGVVGKFVEFCGDGLSELSLADRATIANMAPEYGATCGFFPIDDETITYLKFTGRPDDEAQLVEDYAKAQGFWREAGVMPSFTTKLTLDLSTVTPSLAGPKRPQDRIVLSEAKAAFDKHLKASQITAAKPVTPAGKDFQIDHGSIMIAAITSCTNTSNPSVLISAGIVAKKAAEKGLKVKPWVKTSLAPGSQVVTDYLNKAGLTPYLEQLGFHTVGYGCTTCIGNSGPLDPALASAIHDNQLMSTSVLSGNRNFEGRIGPDIKANYLASPPLVVAYALVGSMCVDITTEPLGHDSQNNPVYLKDIWPSNQEIQDILRQSLNPEMFAQRYANVFQGPKAWQDTKAPEGFTFKWDDQSTYVRHPSFFTDMTKTPSPRADIINAKALAILGDSVTTDHISPAGAIKTDSPAGQYLTEHGIQKADFNSYGSRRGNHEVMMRGTFANIRIRNEIVPGTEGGYTKGPDSDAVVSIYDAAMAYAAQGTPTVVIGGKEYGTGSSRDWAAKGTNLLGVRAVISESFERIHRSNLIGMGVLPLQFMEGQSRESLGLSSSDQFTITGISNLAPRQDLSCSVTRADGSTEEVTLRCRIDTEDECAYFNNGGILHYVLRKLCS